MVSSSFISRRRIARALWTKSIGPSDVAGGPRGTVSIRCEAFFNLLAPSSSSDAEISDEALASGAGGMATGGVGSVASKGGGTGGVATGSGNDAAVRELS